jgi:hypothetical protein
MFTAVAHSWGIPSLESRLFTGESIMSWEALSTEAKTVQIKLNA